MKKGRKKGREEKKKKKKRNKVKKGMDCVVLYGLLWISMDFWTFVWILVCSISRARNSS